MSTSSTLLRSVRVVDVDAGRVSAPVDVRVQEGVVVSAGPEVAAAAGPGDAVVDLAGRWLMPGLWDAHTHMNQWALARQRLDLAGATSARAATDLVVAGLATAAPPDGAMLVGFGFRDGLWPDAPTAALLDDAIAAAGLPPAPVVLISGDVHCAWFSTPALRRVGAAAHPTGLLRETEWLPLMAVVDDVPAQAVDGWVEDAARAAAARGVVGVVDLEIADNLESWRRRVVGGCDAVRVQAGLWPEHLAGVVGRGLASGDPVPGTCGLVTTGPLKVITDGSLNTRTAYCHHPYGEGDPRDDAHQHGVLNVAPDELVPLMALAHRHGLACALHAIGDRAVGLVLDAFATTGARGSVEHAQLVAEPDLDRMAALGIVASVQPEHAMDDRDVADRYWAGRTGRAFAYGSLVRAGVRLALGSDAPVAPLDPWLGIAAAVDRVRDGREPWHPEQRVEPRVALAASVRSRVAPGQPADLVVLDADPLTVRGEDLRRMPVAGTLLAGRWTCRAF